MDIKQKTDKLVHQHPALSKAMALLSGEMPKTSVELFGATYHLQLQRSEATTWVANHVTGQALAALTINMKKPEIAVAFIGLDVGDGMIPVESLFTFGGDMAPEVIAYLKEDKTRERDWRREQVLAWLDTLDDAIITGLYKALSDLFMDHQKALGKLRPLPKATQS